MRFAWFSPFSTWQVESFCSSEFDVSAGGVEMRVVRDDVSLFAHHAEENALRGASLMRRDHVPIPEDVLHGTAERVEAAAASIALIAAHNRCPLIGGHRACT